MKKNILLILTALTSLFFTKVNYGQAPNLGASASFGVFTSVGLISNTGSTTITGDFGNYVGGSTGTPPTVIGQTHQTDPVAQQAALDVCAAYTDAQTAPCDNTVALLGEGQIITPGVTCVVAASTVTGDLVMDAQGDPNAVFIIRVNGVLNTGASSQIVLTNGANLCNVFFTVLGAVNLGANSVFNGTILESGGAASIGANAVINGRLLDCVGAINLDNNTITNPCTSTPPCPTIAAPTATVVQPTCTVATGAITVTSGTSGLTFSLNSTDPAAFTNTTGVFSDLASGTYIIRSMTAAGCISDGLTVTVNAQPATPTLPTATVTQPTCTVATGVITVTSPTTGLTFSLNSTNPADFTNTTVFSNLAPGTYTIRAMNAAGCISAGLAVTINAQPAAPAAPTTDVTQPTCTVATGAITVISGTAGLTFTLSNGNGTTITSTTGVFSNLAPGTYTLTFRNAAGCISASNTVVINAQPAAPALPTTSVTQPTCAVATGTISVTSGTTGLTFSINSTSTSSFTSTTVFSNLAPGTYIIRARNAAGCISAGVTVTVNAPPAAPATPSVIVTEPTCAVGTGTITVACCTAGLTFSINSTSAAAFTNTTGVFSNLAPGTYIIRSRNAAGCISTGCTIVITARPTNCACTIATPTGSVTQPTCAVATGTIRVTSGITGLTFSINSTLSTSFTNTTGLFSNLARGTYIISARNAAGCISSGLTLVVNAPPATPASLTSSVTHPTCTVGTGTIRITSGITGLHFSINSTSSTSFTNTTGVFSNLAPGTYTIRSRNAAGCVSAGLTKVINAKPTNCNCVIATPTGSVTQPTCTVGTGTIRVTSGITGLHFSINSTSSTSFTNTTGVFSNLAPGTYIIRSRNSIGCVSAGLTKVVNAKPASPAAPTVSVTQPTCTVATGTISVTSGITGLHFSINSTSSTSFTNTTGVFSNLVAGTYTVRFRNAAGCISSGRTVTIYVCAAAPGTPTVSVTQPTCTVGTGTIRVSCCITGLHFSINSTSSFTSTTGVFSNLAPGTYIIRSRNASGCISPARTVVVNARPTNCGSLAKPIGSVENAEEVSTLSVKVSPNPYSDKVRFVIESPVSGQGSLDVYNLLGQKLQNVYQGHINAGRSQTIDFNVPASMRTHLIYTLSVGGRRVSGRILKQ